MHHLASERARKGALVMDNLHPGWVTVVDPEILDMGNPMYCALGQLSHEGFTVQMVKVYNHIQPWARVAYPEVLCNDPMRDSLTECATEYGFDVLNQDYGYDELTEAWQAEIKDRCLAHA